MCYNEDMAIAKNGKETTFNGSLGQTVDIYNGDWEALKILQKNGA